MLQQQIDEFNDIKARMSRLGDSLMQSRDSAPPSDKARYRYPLRKLERAEKLMADSLSGEYEKRN